MWLEVQYQRHQDACPPETPHIEPCNTAATGATGAKITPTAAAAAHLRYMEVDEKGRALARGRRKASSARVWLSHGVGDVVINKKPLGAYFNSAPQRASVIAPLTVLGKPGRWNINATVEGGGTLSFFWV